MSFEQFKAKVKSGKVFALFGDRALMDEALLLVRQDAQINQADELNYHRFYNADTTVAECVATLNTLPFLSKRRYVEFHDAEKLAAGDIIALTEYIKNPSDFSVLILLFNKIDKRNKFISFLLEQQVLYDLSIGNASDCTALIIGIAKDNNLIISQSTAQYLMLILNEDLLAIKHALKKMALLGKKELSVDDIDQHIVASTEQDVFLLARSISEGKLSKALIALAKVKQNQENALKFLGVLVWQFRLFVHIRSLIDQGMSEWDIRKQVSVYGDRFTWMAEIAKKRTSIFHIKRLTKILESDRFLKTQKISEPFTVIEKLVYQSAIGL